MTCLLTIPDEYMVTFTDSDAEVDINEPPGTEVDEFKQGEEVV